MYGHKWLGTFSSLSFSFFICWYSVLKASCSMLVPVPAQVLVWNKNKNRIVDKNKNRKKTMITAPSSQNTEQEYSLSHYLNYLLPGWQVDACPFASLRKGGVELGGAKSEGGAIYVAFFPCPSKPPRPEIFFLVSYAVD